MHPAELIALVTGVAVTLSVRALRLSCVERRPRWLTIALLGLPALNLALVALVFTSPSIASVRAFAIVSLAFSILALAIAATMPRRELVCWPAFESAFWRYVEQDSGR